MTDATSLLRAGLLDGRRIVAAGPARDELREALAALGADVRVLDVDLAEEAAVEAAAATHAAGADALVVDAAGRFAGAQGGDELGALRAVADGAWCVTRSVANVAWIAPQAPGGKIVLVAPGPGEGPHAAATRAALENLARTLSIEWARFGVRTTAITPGQTTSAADVATLVAYLVSPAGDYFSGCRLDLGAIHTET
jgi:NAD(P)-dependent dehydrogenase (short-subunit alcohol dehydrogenase family)